MERSSIGAVDRHYVKITIICILALVVLTVSALFTSDAVLQILISEGGPIQTFSAAGYVVAVVVLYRELGGAYARKHFYLIVFPTIMCLREMDFHVHFTSISITKSTFYVSSEVPLLQKIIVILLLLFLIWSGYLMVRRHGDAFLRGLRRGDAAALALAVAGIFAVASKGLDGIGRKLAEWGIVIGDLSGAVALVAEEMLELGIPVFMVIAVFAHASKMKRI